MIFEWLVMSLAHVTYDLVYIIRGHNAWNLKIYKGINNCVVEIKDTFWMIDNIFGTNYNLVYIINGILHPLLIDFE